VQEILTVLGKADLVVALVSRAYAARRFCQAELGAAVMRHLQHQEGFSFNSFIVPPFEYGEQDGALYGIQSGSIIDPSALDGLWKLIAERTGGRQAARWEASKTKFLAASATQVRSLQAAEIVGQIGILDVHLEDAPMYTFKKKLRVVLRNRSDVEITIGPGAWEVTASGILPTHGTPHFQVEGPKRWVSNDWGDEQNVVVVGSYRAFRCWIGLPDNFTAVEVRRRQLARELGKLKFRVRVGEYDFAHVVSL
jgi:hypothetical protein